MKRVDLAARSLHSRLSAGFRRTGSLVHNPNYALVVKGFDFERTGYKDTLNFNLNTKIFFSDNPFVTLTYADRLSNLSGGDKFLGDMFSGSMDEIADQCWATIGQLGLVQQLQQPYTMSDFLQEHCAHVDPAHSINYRLTETACAAALVGDFDRAERYLDAVAAMQERDLDDNGTLPDYDVIRYGEAAAYRAALKRGKTALISLIVECATRNARKFGFEPVGPAATAEVLPAALALL